jgi:SNF2 family DNA or RNA helicase
MLTKSKRALQPLKANKTRSKLKLIRKHQGSSSAKLKKRKRPAKHLNLSNWNTTDLDEIERRRLRAKTEKLKWQLLEPQYDYFGSFLVSSKERQTQYRVEIRSLNEYVNSCDCLDYRMNQLGTCKHIEHALLRLQRNRQKQFKQIALEGSPRIEIYLDRREGANTLCLLWPRKLKKAGKLWQSLDSFFKPDGTLQVDLVEAHAQIQAIIFTFKNKVRFSTHIQDVIAQETLRREAKKRNKILLKKLAQNKPAVIKGLKFPLYPYQEQGMLHLVLNRRALLADEMGLGKTVQAIAACELLKRSYGIKKVLVIATASLKAEWEEQISKFTSLKSLIIQGTRPNRLEQYKQDAFFYLTNYEQIVVDGADIQQLIAPDVIILDEAQRIKNWQTKTANAVKQLKSPYAFVLTGTPLENRIDDIYSIVQFLDPSLFGPLFRFNRDFYQLDEIGKPTGYKNLDKLHQRLKPVMLRRRKEEVEGELPERTVNHYFVSMEKEQRLRYEEYENKVARLVYQAKRRPLRKEEYEKLQKWLACMRMICDSPYILDPKCKISPKLRELENTLEELLQDKTAKIIIFSEWERMLSLVLELTEKHDW